MVARKLKTLLPQIKAATGRDHDLDLAIAHAVAHITHDEAAPAYTSSVDACIALIEHTLPGWHWHVGYGPDGVFPYASVRKGKTQFEAQSATVPLALLTALLEARLSIANGE